MTHDSEFWKGKTCGLTQAADELAGLITTSREERDVIDRAERLIRDEAEDTRLRYQELVRHETCDLPMSER